MSSASDRAEALQAGADALMRIGDEQHAKALYAMALATMPAPYPTFRCNPDESGGLAEVVNLREWSVRCE